MAKRIDYEAIVGQIFTNKKGQTYKVTNHICRDKKHLYNVVFIDPQEKSYKTVINSTVKYTAMTKEKTRQFKSEPPLRYERIKNLKNKTVLAIDGATYTTGLALYRPNKPLQVKEITAEGTTLERIEQMRKQIETDIIRQSVDVIFYEEPLLKHASATFTLGALFTKIKDLAKSKGIEFVAIKPSSWQSYHGIHTTREEGKKMSRTIASKLMKRPMGEDESDAVCMLIYCVKELEAA